MGGVVGFVRTLGRASVVGALPAILALTLAGCGSDDGGGAPADLGLDLHVPAADLTMQTCPPTQPGDETPCGPTSHALICRYPSDAGPDRHSLCLGSRWQNGDCPFGPTANAPLVYDGCTHACADWWGEQYQSCNCDVTTGRAVCCLDTGFPVCGNYDGGM